MTREQETHDCTKIRFNTLRLPALGVFRYVLRPALPAVSNESLYSFFVVIIQQGTRCLIKILVPFPYIFMTRVVIQKRSDYLAARIRFGLTLLLF
jgi:hypothetical protein